MNATSLSAASVFKSVAELGLPMRTVAATTMRHAMSGHAAAVAAASPISIAAGAAEAKGLAQTEPRDPGPRRALRRLQRSAGGSR